MTDYSSGLIRGVSRATLRDDFSPSFYLRHMLKDVRLIEDLARRLAVPLPATAGIAPLYQAAVNEGLGDLNASGLHKLLFSMSGLELLRRSRVEAGFAMTGSRNSHPPFPVDTIGRAFDRTAASPMLRRRFIRGNYVA